MSKVASLFYLVPAVTAVIAWALFGEQLTLVQIAGMALDHGRRRRWPRPGSSLA